MPRRSTAHRNGRLALKLVAAGVVGIGFGGGVRLLTQDTTAIVVPGASPGVSTAPGPSPAPVEVLAAVAAAAGDGAGGVLAAGAEAVVPHTPDPGVVPTDRPVAAPWEFPPALRTAVAAGVGDAGRAALAAEAEATAADRSATHATTDAVAPAPRVKVVPVFPALPDPDRGTGNRKDR